MSDMPSDSRRSSFLSALLGALVVAVVFAGLALGGVFDSDDDDSPAPVASAPADSDQGSVQAAKPKGSVVATDVSSIYEAVRPGVVSIETRTAARPGLGGQPSGGTGSGFILDEQGNILTNDHVVEDASSVRVRFAKGQPVAAKVVASDPSTDLALVRVPTSGRDLQPLSLGSSKDIKVGEPAIALGSPFGLDGTLTTGVVSALERTIRAPNNFSIDNVVQTDAAINPGNSGGPLLDDQGRVIGVNAQIATDTQQNSGVGFAIPIDTAKQVLPDLRAGKDIKRPYLGVSTTEPPSGSGALVAQVVPAGPAQKAGIRTGDRIVSINGRTITSSEQVSQRITQLKPGDKVKIGIRRGGDTRSVTATLGTRPDKATGALQGPP
jgi:putative serine protease PepD